MGADRGMRTWGSTLFHASTTPVEAVLSENQLNLLRLMLTTAGHLLGPQLQMA